MVHFVVYVWAGSFLNGKMFPAHFVGPKLILLEVMLIKKHCRPSETAVLQNAININGQYVHHENIIFCLLHSQDETERRLGVQTILRIRDQHPSCSVGNLRSFVPGDHRVNMRALSLSNLNLIPLSAAVHEPPVTERLSRDEVISFLDSPLDSLYPITSVSVERAVKDTTAVSLMATSEAQRNGILQLRIRSRLADKANK